MRRSDLGCAIACAVVVLAAFLLVNPIAGMGFDDDWCYAFTVQKLLQTGHFIYSGWGSPALITQALWGACWARIFGFSFTTLRFSTLPLAMGCAVVCYLLGRIAGLRPTFAVFAAMLLSLSPMFLPLATSFMTDVPGLFFMLLCMYALAKLAMTRRTIWLAVAIASAAIGGTTRQIVWIIPLVILPYLLWLGRSDRRYFVVCISAWFIVLVGAIWTQSWFASQPNVVLDPPLSILLQSTLHNPWPGLRWTERFFLTMSLLTLPAGAILVVCVIAACRRRLRLLLICAIVGAALAVNCHLHPDLLAWPWSPNLLWPRGILLELEMSGHPPSAMPDWCVAAWSVLVFIALGAPLALLLDFVTRRRNIAAVARKFAYPQAGEAVVVLLAIVAVAYTAILLARSMRLILFDRYALPMIPIAAIFTLLYVQRSFLYLRIRTVAVTAGSLVLIFYAVFALATTHDLLALDRARVSAIHSLRESGVAVTAISAGFEYDCWIQLEAQNHVNYIFTSNRNYRFRPMVGLTPAVWHRYRVEYGPTSETRPGGRPPIRFIAWLPPFHRAIYIDTFFNPKWLSPPPPESRPLAGNMKFQTLF